MTETQPIRRLGAIIYDNFELLDLFGPLEMFGNVVPEIKIITVAEQPGPIPSVQGPKTVAEFGFSDCPGLDLILLPGGLGTLAQLKNPALLGFLKDRASSAEVIMSVCSGSALLAKAGLLDGRRATSNKQFFNLAANQSDRVKWIDEARWVEDGPLVTSSGVSAGLDMALAVIARLFGRERAESIANRTEYLWQEDPKHDPFHKFLNRGGV